MSKHRVMVVERLDDDTSCRVVTLSTGKRPRYRWEVWQRVEHGVTRSKEAADLQIGAVRHGLELYTDLRRREFIARLGGNR